MARLFLAERSCERAAEAGPIILGIEIAQQRKDGAELRAKVRFSGERGKDLTCDPRDVKAEAWLITG
jgi:hypothetical protein